MNPTAGVGMFGDADTVWTQTYGLACDDMKNNWGLLDTDADEFKFEDEL